MMQHFGKKWVAYTVTICVILLSVLLGGRSSLLKLRDEAIVNYMSDMYGGNGLEDDLELVLADSYNLTTIAQRYLPQDDVHIVSVLRDRETLRRYMGHSTPKQVAAAANDLRTSVEDLSKRMSELKLNDIDKTYRGKLITNIESIYTIIANTPYNEAAAAFNNTLQKQPAAMLAEITGIEPLDLYE